ncbi:MAG: flagellar filament capping protein FliD [Hahellaceae bacterium]|nr:flagellar filament capping protein FliD [Hahellaceae bacterium]
MASISSVGIGSGVLTSDLIDKLANAEREPTEKRLDAKREDVNAQLSEVGRLKSSLSDLRLTSRLLSNPDAIKSNLISSSNSTVSGTATEKAAVGQYSINVTNLAQAHSLASGVFTDLGSTPLGTGTLRLTVGGVTRNLAIDSTNNTLQGIADKINSETNLSAVASVINTGSGYQLVLSSTKEGTAHAISLSVTDNDGNLTDSSGLSQLTSGAKAITQVVAAEDLTFTINGLQVTRSSNTVDDLLKGVTLQFNEESSGAPALLKIERDTVKVTERVQDLVDKYNALKTIISETTKYDPANGEVGVLLGEAAVRTISQQTRATLYGLVKGLESANVRSLADLGIKTDKETGLLSFDSARFKNRLQAYPDDVAAVFAEQGRTSDAQVQFQTANINTVAGTYDIVVTVAAAQGQFVGAGPIVGASVAASPGKFVAGPVATGVVTATSGVFTGSGAMTTSGAVPASSGEFTAASAISTSSTPATSGVFTATGAMIAAASTGLITISASNDNLVIEVDGVTSGTITLDSADYTSNDLVSEIQNKIDADGALSGAGKSVTVSVDGGGKLVFTSTSTGSSSSVNVISADADTFATLGFDAGSGVDGTDISPQQVTVNSDNDELVIEVDGISSGTLTLGSGTYTPAELVTELQNKIDADSALSTAGKSVVVSLDGGGKLVITSASTGTSSSVNVISVDNDTLTTLGFAAGSGVDGLDASAGTVTIDADNNELVIEVDGVSSGTLTITSGSYSQSQLVDELQSQIDADSALSVAGKSVIVSVDGSGKLVITSTSTGGSSSVNVVSVDTDTLSTLGFDAGSGVDGIDGSAGNATIDSSNDAFVIEVDGVTSGTITLDSGDYTQAEIVAELQSKIDADTALSAAGKSITVSINGSGDVVLTSGSVGASSSVKMISTDTGTLATLGFAPGNGTPGSDGSTGGPTTINASNDNFKIAVDGVNSGTLTLSSGTYTTTELVAEVQRVIDADSTLMAAGKSAVVSVLDSGELVITSKKFGSTSSVSVVSTDSSTLATLGFAAGSGTAGVDVRGTINGATATGKGKLLTASASDDSKGIAVEVSGTAIGSRGKVTYIRGIADEMVDTVTSFIKFEGTLSSYETRLNKQLTKIADERKLMEKRISNLTERLAKQFTAADILVSQFNKVGEFLTSQLAALNPGGNK